MVKLISLKGDSTISKNEIRGAFREPIIIQPKSRIALVGCEVDFQLTNQNEEFQLSVTDSLVINKQNVTFTAGTYSQADFIKEINEKLGLIGSNLSSGIDTAGIDLGITYQNSKVIFERGVFALSNQDFDTKYVVNGGVATPTTYTGPGDCFSNDRLPTASYTMTGTINGVGEGNIGVYKTSDTKFFHGLNIDSTGTYNVIYNGTTIPTAELAQVNDVFEIRREKNQLYVSITRGGSSLFLNVNTLTQAQWRDLYEDIDLVVLAIEAIGALSINNLSATTVQNTNPPEKQNQITLLFNTTILADYLGWDSVGPHTSSFAAPSVLTPPNELKGDDKYPGIQIILDPFVLESYSSYTNLQVAQRQGTSQSIIYVIHDVANLGDEIAFNVPSPLPLNIKNNQPINLNQLRVKFRNSSTNVDLSFQGNPAITLAIYDPDE